MARSGQFVAIVAEARKDLSELSDEKLMNMISTLGADLGLRPIKTIDANAETVLGVQQNDSALRLVPKGRFTAQVA